MALWSWAVSLEVDRKDVQGADQEVGHRCWGQQGREVEETEAWGRMGQGGEVL